MGSPITPSRPQGLSSSNTSSKGYEAPLQRAASSLSADLQQTAKAAARAAKAQASEFAADVGHEMSQVAEQQKVRGVEAMQGFARAINSAASELDRQSPMVAGYVRNAARQVDGFSNNIRGRNITELMHAATDLAKAQPVVFLAGAMAAGFALSRFLKSSAPDNGSHAPRSGSPSELQRNRPAAGSQYQSGSTHGASGGVGSTSRGS